MKIGPRLRFHILIFLKVFCQEHCIIQVNIRHHFIIRICHIRLQGQHIHGLFPDEKILRVDLVQQKHVIIEIDKPLGKSQNPVKIPFDGMGIKGRQKFRRDEIFVLYNMKLRMLRIQPFGEMPPGDKMNFPYPGCKLFHTAKPVL